MLITKTDLEEILKNYPGELGLYVKNLNSGECFEWNAEESFPTASVIKLPLLVTIFDKIEKGELNLDQRFLFRGSFSKIFATGFFKFFKDEPEVSLRDLLSAMIFVSDDVATDFLLDLVGLDSVNLMMENLGCSSTHVCFNMGNWHYNMVYMGDRLPNDDNDKLASERYRKGEKDLEGVSWSKSLRNDVASAKDMAKLLEGMYRGEIVSSHASGQMIALLNQCTSRNRIREYLKRDIEVAHKTGGSFGIKNDVGIIYFQTAPVIISAFTLNMKGTNAGAEVIADAAKKVTQNIEPDALAEPG